MATITIEIPDNIKFLSEYKEGVWDFSQGLPNGILYKKFTGIGATHCEIIAKRDSILVFPTIALARSKYLKAVREPQESFRYQFLNGDIKNEEIENFISDKGEKSIDKFFVVADSLPRLMNFLGKKVYDNYFLMVDEIDTFQVDTSFRSSLEFAIDYFKYFKKKCALTATLIPFSDPDFHEEKIDFFILKKVSFEKPEIKLVNVYYPLDTLTYEIVELLKEKEKIVVAINSFNGINNIIKNLLKLRKIDEFKTGVLCSQYSKYKIHSKSKWVDVPETGKIQLEQQLTFVTSAYFTGVDLDEEFHLLIGVLNVPQHAMLTFENIYQITGRARNGFLSCKIVKFSTINTSVKYFDRNEIIERVEKVNSLFIHAKEIYSDNEFSDDYASIKSAFGKIKISGEKGFVRENIDGEIVPSPFTIDYKEHFFKSISDYETGANSLLERLQYYFEVQEENDFSDMTKELDGFTGVDFAENFSDQIPRIFNDIYDKILNNEELNVISGIEQAVLFKFIYDQRNNKRMYAASLQMVFLIEKYGQDYGLLKKKFIELNKNRFLIKDFYFILKLYQLYHSPQYELLKKFFYVNSEYTAEELVNLWNDILYQSPDIKKYISSSRVNDNAYVVDLIIKLFDVEKITIRKRDKLTGKRSPVKYKLLDFKSSYFQRERLEEFTGEKFQDIFGISHKKYLLGLKEEDLSYLIK